MPNGTRGLGSLNMKWVHHLFSGEDNESAHLAGVGKSDVDVEYRRDGIFPFLILLQHIFVPDPMHPEGQ